MSQTIAGIQGIVFSGATPVEPPTILVLGEEKTGKSTLACSLVDWPAPGMQPLVLAFDATGPDSCFQLGYQIPNIKIGMQPGTDMWSRTQGVLNNLEAQFRPGSKARSTFGSLVIDCGSTLADTLWQEIENPIKLQAYGELKDKLSAVYWRLAALRIPTVWLAWLQEASVDNKTKKIIQGGPMMTGNFRRTLAGKATQVMLLAKKKVGTTAPGADREGYVRVLYSKMRDNIALGGRFALPDPCPPHLGWVMSAILNGTGTGPSPIADPNPAHDPVPGQSQPA